MITDSLRAEHYQATKGSFKFTHETWEAITRQRDEYPADTEMVGWYHTHPDWSVFLSGMDLFICENFFNRPLDVAIVIDPCRGDRGVFFWDPLRPGEIRRAEGFHLVTSRHREFELAHYASLLEGDASMRPSPSQSTSYGPAPVINVSDPRAPWLLVALISMLTVQLCALLIVAWKLAAPVAENKKENEALTELVTLLKDRRNDELREASIDAKLEVLDRIMAQSEGAPRAAATQLASQEEEIGQLKASLVGLNAAQREANQRLEGKLRELDKVKAEASNQEKKLIDTRAALDEAHEKIKALRGKDDESEEKEEGDKTLFARLRSWIVPGAITILALVAVVVAASKTMKKREVLND